MRLEKYLVDTCCVSRSVAKKLIKEKRISVNGVFLTKSIEVSENDLVMLDEKILTYTKFLYYMLNKPLGYVTSKSESEGSSIYSLLPRDDLNPVGRLDKYTTGLILFTNNGQCIHNLTSPKKEVEKEYVVCVKETVGYEILKLLEPTKIDNQERGRAIVSAKKVIKTSENEFRIVITDGKFHEVRQLVSHIGLTIDRLKRVRIGEIYLDESLAEGVGRYLTQKEIEYIEGVK